MDKKAVKRFALIVAGGFVFTGVALAAVAFFGGAFSADSSTASFGWLVPIIAGAVIGVVAFLLLDSDRSVSEPEVELRATACETCGAEVMDEWRMCPHCGAMLDDGQRASRRDYRTRAIL